MFFYSTKFVTAGGNTSPSQHEPIWHSSSAASSGIDSCPIGAFESSAVQQLLELDAERYAVALLLTMGYLAKPQPLKHRLAMAELVEYR